METNDEIQIIDANQNVVARNETTFSFIKKLFRIVKILSEFYPRYDNDMGDSPCFFCGEIHEHAEDCIWKMAQELVNEGKAHVAK